MEEQILEILKNENKALSVHELEDKLGFTTVDELKELLKTLNNLEDNLKIYRTKKDNYMLFTNSHLKIGRMIINKKGFGFVDIEGDEDVFIAPSNLNGAIHNDKVIVEITSKNGMQLEGRILKIVDRKFKEMVGEFIGKPLLDYLNERNKIKFTGIKVVNDTIASLFAGLTDNSYDAYIGLIVGTGTNMATFIPADKIEKLDQSCNAHGLIPVNLESGNFHPPFLTAVDDTVDAISGNPGKQRFEKAVSGMYLGDILKTAFPLEEFEEKFDAQKLTSIMNYPDIYKDVYVQVAQWIYGRSAQLVAASLTGLIMLLKSYNKDIRKVCLVAEGSLFWSENRKDKNYNILVMEKLRELLQLFGLKDIEVDIKSMNNANLIGTGIAALS